MSCSGGDVRFTTKFATGFQPAQQRISVFGVYKDGRMSPDSWGAVAGRLAPALGAPSCEQAYSESFVGAEREIASAVDEYTLSNGPSDELLGQVAPAAQGDLVLVLTVAGRAPGPPKGAFAEDANGKGQRGPGGAGGPGPRGAPRGSSPLKDPSVLDLAAQIFSVAEGRSVGVIELEYAGVSGDDALARFAAKLGQALPGAKCVGWSWAGGKVDGAKIRSLE